MESYEYGFREEKKQPTEHRRYSKISANNDSLTLKMKFSLKLAIYILLQSLTNTTDDETCDLKNVVCSPLSIDAVLNILILGSKGPTLQQLLDVIGSHGTADYNAAVSLLADVLKESKGDDGPEISFVNSLWVDRRFSMNTSFKKVLKDVHKADARSVDFVNKVEEVIKEVNSWAEKESKGFMKELLSENSIPTETVLLLINCLYFKGTWVDRFKQENTKDGHFYLLNGNIVQVPFMNQFYNSFDYGTFDDGCQILRILYNEEEKGSKDDEPAKSFSMYIFLPQKEDGLPNLMGMLSEMDYSTMFREKIKLQHTKIDKLSIPKFDFECELNLKKDMMKLGLTLPFDEKCRDITGIVANSEIFVSKIIQKCRVEIDEEGTKAVAFTKAKLWCGCSKKPKRPPPINFVADHPFLFMIREDYSGALLFVGSMLNPLPN